MPENQTFWAVILGVHASDIECIDVNGFITDNNLFNTFSLVPEHKHISITNIHFVFLFDQKGLFVNLWYIFIDFKNKESKLLLILVGQ